ncbi:transcription antitermination regulator [Kribbella sp. ALI-6-A]|uniref:GAF and ANTAR domain-containing protein n=1 Tax=Kribbella sp. ALI-6-A TaxID=1933817 RepID=UPI00097C52F7|nr:GAF and ANTAR domain-containing protein [Kribbella sp. ALI-6-A]ONI78315.1 transcription antitermination regulator [Kribbella sp. ALI-6-A]
MGLSELLRVMDELAAGLRLPMDLDETLWMITVGAVEAVPGIDHASISITGKDGLIQTLAPTDMVAVRAAELQYELSEGPCLDAVLDEPVVQVDDLASDSRWPVYGPKAAKELGIGAQLAFQFRAEPQHVLGGVNLYCGQAGQITVETRQMGSLFANMAAVALGWSRHEEDLNQALASRSMIGQAVGIVVERYRLDSDRAFAFLARTSQASNIKLRDVAAAIVADADSKAR